MSNDQTKQTLSNILKNIMTEAIQYEMDNMFGVNKIEKVYSEESKYRMRKQVETETIIDIEERLFPIMLEITMPKKVVEGPLKVVPLTHFIQHNVEEAIAEYRDQFDRLLFEKIDDSEAHRKHPIKGIVDLLEAEKIYGVKREGIKAFQPNQFSGRLSIEKLLVAKARTEAENGSNLTAFVCSPKVRASINNEVINNQGREEIIGLDLIVSNYIEENTIYLLDFNSFKMIQLSDWKWIEDEEELVIIKQIEDYKSGYYKYCSLICEDIRKNTVFKIMEDF